MQVLGRSWADAGQLQTFLHHSEAWSRPREARPKTTDWEPVSGQRLGRSLEVPGLGRAGQMLEVWGWRFWRDLVRCWAHVFNLSALPVPCQDRFFLEGFWGFFGVSFLRCFSVPFQEPNGCPKIDQNRAQGHQKCFQEGSQDPFRKGFLKKSFFGSFWACPGP